MTTQNHNAFTSLTLQTPLRASQDETVNYLLHPTSGRTGKFIAQYDQHVERKGQGFTILGLVDPQTYDAHECGQMFCIQFKDGTTIAAWPEEIEDALEVSSMVLTEAQSQPEQRTLLLAFDADAQADYEISPLMLSQGNREESAGVQA